MTATRALPTTGNYHHADVIAPAVSYVPLFDGDAGTFQSLDAMKQAVVYGLPPEYSNYQDPLVIRAARSICAGTSGQDAKAQIAALFDFVSHQLKYEPHPFNQQVVQDCKRTIEIGSGDCVSKSVCLSTLLACLGHISRFVAQCSDGEDFSHVYVEALIDDETWLALDPVAEDQPMGWSQPLPDGGFETTWEVF